MTDVINTKPAVVWLYYMANPTTTGAYLERSLRRFCDVTTVGPCLPDRYIAQWGMDCIRSEFRPHDIVTAIAPDMGQVLKVCQVDRKPDLFVVVDTGAGDCPQNIDALSCPTACYLIDCHIALEPRLELARAFDFVFIAQHEYLDKFRQITPQSYWLPLACEPAVHGQCSIAKQYDVGFAGTMSARNPRRNELLDQLARHFNVHNTRCFLGGMAELYSASRMVFNQAIKNDLNMRFFEALCSGSLLLSDMANNSAQDMLFSNGEEYVCYHDNQLLETARFYLKNEGLREQIAARGRRVVLNAHTYDHRVQDLLDVVLHGKTDTFSPTELRERSLAGLKEPYAVARESAPRSRQTRSFVIPVLDYSPASEYNIRTLLQDLEDIPGEVIVVFNTPRVADELKAHPRITHYVTMQRNVGVSRAWNVGIDVAETPTVFVVNADAHISAEAVNRLEAGLWGLERAACTGPQGSFFDFDLCADYHYLDKGSFGEPVAVDAVSGFFFCIKRELFADKTLRFEDSYTPCYFEEWDLGLQIRKAGLKSYVVPTSAYDHHWSGTIRALRTIPYYDREETAGEILQRNRRLFVSKWRGIARTDLLPELLESNWKAYGSSLAQRLADTGNTEAALQLLDQLVSRYPTDRNLASLQKYLFFSAAKQAVR